MHAHRITGRDPVDAYRAGSPAFRVALVKPFTGKELTALAPAAVLWTARFPATFFTRWFGGSMCRRPKLPICAYHIRQGLLCQGFFSSRFFAGQLEISTVL